MTNLAKLPTWVDKGHIHAVVETPRGSRCKLEFDPKLRAFALAKPLLTGLTYPYDWEFIPSTKADDGDPLDVLIIHDAGTYPGLVLRCKPIGVLEIVQISKGKKERNDRVFVVPDRSPFEGDLQAGKIFRGDRCARGQETGVPGMARPKPCSQDDQTTFGGVICRAVVRPSLSAPEATILERDP